ncbi:4707_t:CDS:1, partial [Dentiscutata erythropus]
MNFVRQSRAFTRLYLTVSNRQFHGSRSVKNVSPTIESTPMRILLLGSP